MKNADNHRKWAKLNNQCVACGSKNANGLQLVFTQNGQGVTATWTPAIGWESFQGTIHGGIVSTVLDEAMSKAVIAEKIEAYTVDLHVRFHHHVKPDEKLIVRGWIVEHNRRRITTKACIVDLEGEERAHAEAIFLFPPIHG